MADKNNIEDFFNNALDGFDREPSDHVWDGVVEQMETPPPFWRMPMFWGFATAALLLFSGFLFYHNSIQNELAVLLEKNEILLAEKNELETNWKNCSKHTLELEKDLGEVLVSNKAQSKFVKSKAKRVEELIANRNSQIADLQSLVNDLIAGNRILESKESHWAAIEAAQRSNQQSFDNINKKDEESSAKLVAIWKEKFAALPPKEMENVESRYARFSKKYPTQMKINLGNADSRVIGVMPKYVLKPKFRLGLTGGTFTTFTDVDASKDPGYSAGISTQLQLIENFGLTADFRYNFQFYNVDLNGVNAGLENTFPHTAFINQNLESISVTNNYFDLPVGLSFNIPTKKNASFYVNPGVSWQLFLPQKFSYNTPNQNSIGLIENRYFLYFGSAFLNAGIERGLNDNLRWQLGLWAEKSLIDLGLERRSTLHLGLRGAVYFGS